MDFYNLVSNVGLATEEIEISRTVLDQARQFFDSTKKEDIDLIPYYADTIRRLLNATDSLLIQLRDTLQNCHDRALEQYQEEQTHETGNTKRGES